MRKLDRTGETNIMTNGIEATITAYRSAKDMDVMFSNGQAAKNISYGNFSRGQVQCPYIIEFVDDYCRIINPNTKTNTNFVIDRDDAARVLQAKSWYSNELGYIIGNVNGKITRLHRYLVGAPDDMIVDHKDSDPSNNRKSNLRICTQSDNVKNQSRRTSSKSGYKGVCWSKVYGKWYAYIVKDYKQYSAGYHECKHMAAKRYNEMATKHHGKFAKLNSIDNCNCKYCVG